MNRDERENEFGTNQRREIGMGLKNDRKIGLG